MSGEITSKTQFPIFNGLAPAAGGPKAIPMTLDFTVNASIEFNLIDEVARDVISFVQSIWVDNSDNANPLEFQFSQTGQRLIVPARAQGIWPVIAPSGLRCVVSTTPGAEVICYIIVLNVPMPMTQYGPISVTANVTANATPVQKNITTSQVTLTGASDTGLAANAARTRVVIQAPVDNAGKIAFNFAGAAVLATCIQLSPGERWDSGTGPVSTQALTVIGTANDLVTFMES